MSSATDSAASKPAEPIPGWQMNAIRARHFDEETFGIATPAHKDRGVLLAEVDRLRAEVETLEKWKADEQRGLAELAVAIVDVCAALGGKFGLPEDAPTIAYLRAAEKRAAELTSKVSAFRSGAIATVLEAGLVQNAEDFQISGALLTADDENVRKLGALYGRSVLVVEAPALKETT
ncbi:MAG: hypothetical protein HOW73_47930 [Polyangiaceae bacterium]|nr:hypothetical protein [Polyangiaceae bacterium]